MLSGVFLSAPLRRLMKKRSEASRNPRSLSRNPRSLIRSSSEEDSNSFSIARSNEWLIDSEGKSGKKRREEMIRWTWFWLKSGTLGRELGPEGEKGTQGGRSRRCLLLGYGASMGTETSENATTKGRERVIGTEGSVYCGTLTKRSLRLKLISNARCV